MPISNPRGQSQSTWTPSATLQGSKATGAQNIGRLTNLMNLNVDTSWYIRYRSTTNPDIGATFPQAVTINNRTAIPRTDADMATRTRFRSSRTQRHFTSAPSSRAAPASMPAFPAR